MINKCYSIIDVNGEASAPKLFGRIGVRLYTRLCDLTSSIKCNLDRTYWRRNTNPLNTAFVVEYELVEIRRTPVLQYIKERLNRAEQRRREREEYKVRNQFDPTI